MKTIASRAQIAENLLQMGLINSPEDYFKVMVTSSGDTTVRKWVRDTKLARKMHPDFDDSHNDHLLIGHDTPVNGSDNCLVCSPKNIKVCWRFILDNEEYNDYNVHSTAYVQDTTVYSLDSNVMPLKNVSHLVLKEDDK